jgi:hypothetical protein
MSNVDSLLLTVIGRYGVGGVRRALAISVFRSGCQKGRKVGRIGILSDGEMCEGLLEIGSMEWDAVGGTRVLVFTMEVYGGLKGWRYAASNILCIFEG